MEKKLVNTCIALATSLLVSTTTASYASDCPVTGGTLVWGHSETTQNLYVHQTGTISTLRILQNIHDGLVTTVQTIRALNNNMSQQE